MNTRFIPIAVCLLLMATAPLAAVEPWADPDLPAKEGLLLWLDAIRQPAAWQAYTKPALHYGAALDVWFDASGAGRHLVQRFQQSQPRYFQAGRKPWRFDLAKTTHLGVTGPESFP